AKLTVFLHHRYKKFGGDKSKGLIMIPCELIEFNGQKLKECVLKLCEKWNLGSEFVAWVNEACIFAATLVDRIVTGYPRDEAAAICEKLGYNDELLDTAEPFGLWVIESEKDFSAEFPLDKAGLNVVFTNNLKPYRDRKVKLLNGAHTSMVLAAYLAGKNIVLECMNDEVIGKYVAKCMNEEIAPTVALPADEVKAFAASVVERFKNPFIKHELLSISLNSVSKWKARVLPSVEEYLQKKGELPKCLTFSLAALIAFYMSDKKDGAALIGDRNGQPYKIMDDAYVLDFFAEKTAEFKSGKLDAAGLAKAVVSNVQFWGKDLSSIKGFEAAVAQNLDSILSKGMNAVLADIVK
ncbi:MAG TPA: tagaturonate reductase, partial [Ruminococcaceae bacterium]|nr:tagaturonate reductase [Oscillospiraceae bacterium]